MLFARNAERTKTRIFVIHRTAASVASDQQSGNGIANAVAQRVSSVNLAQSQNGAALGEANGLVHEMIALQSQTNALLSFANERVLQNDGLTTSTEIDGAEALPSVLPEGNGQETTLTSGNEMEHVKTAHVSINSLEIAQIEVFETINGNNFEPIDGTVSSYNADDEFSLVDGLDNIGDEAASANKNSRTSFSSDYKNSFKSRLNAFGRKIQRTMDNPVALKNFRDPNYHVPGMLPGDINFGAAGTMLSTRVQTLSRLQWYEQTNQQLINQLAVDGYAYKLRGGIGVQIQHGMYKNGGVNVAHAAITYSPKFSISRTISVEPSLRFKMGNKTLANSKMAGVDRVEVDRGNDFPYYPESQPIGKMLWYHDLGAGLMVNTEWFFAGVQMDNFFRHQDNIYNVDIENPHRADFHYIVTLGTDWVSRRENLSFSPYLVYQHNERLSEAWLGANFRWNWLTVGASLSSSLAPAASLGLKFDHFAMTYSADYTKSVMTGQAALSHQLTLRFVSKPSRFGKRLLNL